MNKYSRQNGFSQILILIIISFLAIALPITTKLVQQKQENRSKAAGCSKGATQCIGGYTWVCDNKLINPKMVKTIYKCGETGTTKYNRGNCNPLVNKYNCTESSTGAYTSRGSCEGSCTPTTTTPTTTKYTRGNCNPLVNKYNCTESSTGSYTSKPTCESSCTTVVNPACGSTANTCLLGTPSRAQKNTITGAITWTCTNSEKTISCSVSGTSYPVCGSTADTCLTGTPTNKGTNSVTGVKTWSCLYGGKTVSCTATTSATADPVCGSTVNTCSPGAVSGQTTNLKTGVSTWNCTNNGKTIGCTNTAHAHPLCGSTSNTCLVGGPTGFSTNPTTGTKTWTCENNGLTITCTGASIADTCVSDTKTCSSDSKSLLTCKSDGSGWNTKTCSFGCKDNACVESSEESCTAGDADKCSVDLKSVMTCDTTTKIWKTTACESGKCENNACTSVGGGGGDYDGGGGGYTTVCTPNAVSTTECYDTTHLKKCDSTGIAWIQGDQCATGQVCKNGVCGVFGDSKLSFKIAFLEIKSNVSCLDNFRNVALTIGKAGTDFKKDLTVDILGTGETNSNGFAIFKAENIAMDIGFSGATNVYVKVKGQVHSKMYYCTKDQSAKTTSQSCNIAIDGTVNNLYNYPILAGDVDQNAIVNSLDFGEIRTNLFNTGCGLKSDLTGDGIVNNLDVRLFKIALEAKYDE